MEFPSLNYHIGQSEDGVIYKVTLETKFGNNRGTIFPSKILFYDVGTSVPLNPL